MSQPTNLNILIIDDNPDIHKDFIKILTANSSSSERKELDDFSNKLFGTQTTEKSSSFLPTFHIDTATQGQEGVEQIKKALEANNPYALAFVDIRMPPGWDGIETIKHIWELDPDIQIVICTAYSDYSWEETVAELGARENLLILKKPFDHIAVRQLSCALTKKWQLLRDARDYTELLEKSVAERTSSLQESLSVTRGTLESSADGVVVVNKQNNIIDYNKKLIEMWKIPETILNEKNSHHLFEIIAEQIEHAEGFIEIINTLSANQAENIHLDKIKCKDGRIIEYCSLPYKLNDEIAGLICSFRDITERALLEDKIQHQALHDPLTDLPNRALLMDRIQQTLVKAKREKSSFGIMFFDLDRFKLINDSFSHGVGDRLLQAVSGRLILNIREMDTLARLGGDEFVGIISNLKEENQLIKVAKKLIEILQKPFDIMGHEINVSTSIGISVYPTDGENVDELLRNADAAMYHAKELGGKQFQFYSQNLSKESSERLEAETDLHRAIKNNEFFLCYQPQFNLQTKQLVSVEALIRWKHPTKGIVLPVDFIPLAEETGLITTIGEWILNTACEYNKHLQELGLPKIRMSINMTTRQFKQPNIVNIVKNTLEKTGLEPKYLEIELTENVIINNIESAHAITELKDMGVSIALDDFGTGYSNINYLRKIPIDRLKIDEAFIKNITGDRGDEIIVQAIIAMAQNLNLEILAEGVNSQHQLDFLKLKECKEGQGYYFSEALSNENLEKLLKNSTEPEVEIS